MKGTTDKTAVSGHLLKCTQVLGMQLGITMVKA
jgi:hypothetical protein